MNYPKDYVRLGNAESQKIWPLLKDYFITDSMVGLDIGCGARKIPNSVGIDFRKGDDIDIQVDIQNTPLKEIIEKSRLVESPEWMDQFSFIFSSHLIEDFEKQEGLRICRDWFSCLRSGGLLIIYVPEKGKYKGTNLAHKNEFMRGDMEVFLYQLTIENWKDYICGGEEAKIVGEVVLSYYESTMFEDKYGVLGIVKKL